MNAHKFTITSNDPMGYTTKVTLDGKELQGVLELRLYVSAKDFTRLELDFLPGSIEVDTVGTVEVTGDAK